MSLVVYSFALLFVVGNHGHSRVLLVEELTRLK